MTAQEQVQQAHPGAVCWWSPMGTGWKIYDGSEAHISLSDTKRTKEEAWEDAARAIDRKAKR